MRIIGDLVVRFDDLVMGFDDLVMGFDARDDRWKTTGLEGMEVVDTSGSGLTSSVLMVWIKG